MIKMTAEAGNNNAIRRITKLSSVICGAPGTGIGMLIYAEIHKIAANIAIMTKLCGCKCRFCTRYWFCWCFHFIIPSLVYILSKASIINALFIVNLYFIVVYISLTIYILLIIISFINIFYIMIVLPVNIFIRKQVIFMTINDLKDKVISGGLITIDDALFLSEARP